MWRLDEEGCPPSKLVNNFGGLLVGSKRDGGSAMGGSCHRNGTGKLGCLAAVSGRAPKSSNWRR